MLLCIDFLFILMLIYLYALMYCAKSAVTSHGPGKDFNSGHSNG